MTVEDWKARYEILSVENNKLRMQVTPEPIADKHKDGDWWLVWDTVYEAWINGRWRKHRWIDCNGSFISNAVTHALPLPPTPEVKNVAE